MEEGPRSRQGRTERELRPMGKQKTPNSRCRLCRAVPCIGAFVMAVISHCVLPAVLPVHSGAAVGGGWSAPNTGSFSLLA